MAFSFIHTGDLHLDSPLTGLRGVDDERAPLVAGAARRAFVDVVDLAIDRRVDAVLIAGDLWDGDWPDLSAGLFVEEQAGRLQRAGIAVVAILGNHDAASRVTNHLRSLSALHLLPETEPGSLECGAAVIHGQSFARPDVTDNLAAGYPAPVPGRINIGLLHTALDGSYGHSPYAPCSLAQLSAKGYDYWALGHVHTRAALQAEPAGQGGTIAYCGVLQGRHARELEPKGVWHGVVEEAGAPVRLTPVDLDHVAWYRAVADVAAEEAPAAIDRALREVAARIPPSLRCAVVRLVLAGRTARHHALSVAGETLRAEAALAAARADGRLLIERVSVESEPPADEPAVRLPHGFEAQLTRAARSEEVLAQAKQEIGEVLSLLPNEARTMLMEQRPDLADHVRNGRVEDLVGAAASALAARLQAERRE